MNNAKKQKKQQLRRVSASKNNSKTPNTQNYHHGQNSQSTQNSQNLKNYSRQDSEHSIHEVTHENDRLKSENRLLRSRLLQSTKSDSGSTRGISANTEEDDDVTFMMMQEYMLENETLRTKNSELTILREQTQKNWEHIQDENNNLKNRITFLERQVGHAVGADPSGFPKSVGASSGRSVMQESHDRFMRKLSETPRHSLIPKPPSLSNVLNQEIGLANTTVSPSSHSQNINSHNSNQNLIPPELQKPKSGYLANFKTHIPTKSPRAKSKSPRAKSPAPHQVAIIKPKPKQSQPAESSYSSILNKKMNPKGYKRESNNAPQDHQPSKSPIPFLKGPPGYQNAYQNSYVGPGYPSNRKEPLDLIKPRPVPPHKRKDGANAYNYKGTSSMRLGEGYMGGGKTSNQSLAASFGTDGMNSGYNQHNSYNQHGANQSSGNQNSNGKKQWNSKLTALSQLQSRMRNDIKSLEREIRENQKY